MVSFNDHSNTDSEPERTNRDSIINNDKDKDNDEDLASVVRKGNNNSNSNNNNKNTGIGNGGFRSALMSYLGFMSDRENWKVPPLRIDDEGLLLCDIFLLLNLTGSISFWIVHRMSFDYILPALSEGSLICILWFVAGWFRGAFINPEALDNGDSESDTSGPNAAGLMGLNTFIDTSILRVTLALILAVLQHRQVGSVPGEDLMLLEISFGLVQMSLWRALHSVYTSPF